MLIRGFTAALLERLLQFPIVTLLGPRQCGKTTLARAALPGWTYLDLERPSDAAPLMQDPEGRLTQLRGRVIFDEAQQVPSFFPVLRGVVDEHRKKNGRFVLLGSASPTLVRRISESLAGRTGFVDMTPFLWNEVKKKAGARGMENLWFRGGFPDAYFSAGDHRREQWFEAYTRTFIERDLGALGIEVSPQQMRRLWTMLAHVHGGLWNASELAAALGTNYHTVNRYCDILEQTFLVRKLRPFYANVGKRVVKSPKVYLRDTGLLHYFLGIRGREALDTHPKRGMSWEGFVIEQVLSAVQLKRPGVQAYFWKTSSGAEVDLLLETGKGLIPIEIKLHSAPGRADVRGLYTCMGDLKIKKGYVINPGKTTYSLGDGVTVVPFNDFLINLDSL